MVGSIDPRCEPVRGTHWPKPGRVVDWNSRRGNHLGQRFKPTASTGRTYGCKRSDLTQKTLVPRGPSTYGSLLSQDDQDFVSQGRRRICRQNAPRQYFRISRFGVMIPTPKIAIARHSVVHAVLSTSSIADAPSVRASVSGRDGGRLEA